MKLSALQRKKEPSTKCYKTWNLVFVKSRNNNCHLQSKYLGSMRKVSTTRPSIFWSRNKLNLRINLLMLLNQKSKKIDFNIILSHSASVIVISGLKIIRRPLIITRNLSQTSLLDSTPNAWTIWAPVML